MLTRAIVRQLLRNEPLSFRGCLHQSSVFWRCKSRRLEWPPQQRRLIFGSLFPRSSRAVRVPHSSVAKFKVMQDAWRKDHMRVRMPETIEIAKAWEGFMEDKLANNEQITDFHTFYLYTAYKYLRDRESIDERTYISPAAYRLALSAIGDLPDDVSTRIAATDPSFHALATELYRVVESQHPSTDGLLDVELVAPLLTFVRALTFSGHTADARLELTKYLDQEDPLSLFQHWRAVVKGFSKERNVPELNATASLLKEKKPQLYEELRRTFLEKYAELDAMDEASTAFLEIAESKQLTPPTYSAILQACARNNDLEFGHSIARTITELGSMGRSSNSALVLMWALETGRSVEDLDRMLQATQQRNPELTPDTTFIEIILDSNAARKDPYLTERILQRCSKWDVQPNNWIWKRIVDSRLLAGDIEGALAAWREFDEDIDPIPWHRDTCLNKIVVAMINSKKFDFEIIMSTVEPLTNKHAVMHIETLVALTRFHLLRKEYHEAIDLLKTHAPNLFIEDRLQLLNVCIGICLDRNNKIMNCWDTYMVFHQILERESDRTVRTKIMNEFFARRRPDMAVHVFDHMREHWREDIMPTVDTYVDAFVGLARAPDNGVLESINNHLKLDMNVEPSTRLYNALLLAMASSNEPRLALPYWREIISGPEGPNHNTVKIIFQVCEKIPFGDQFASAVWTQLTDANIKVDADMLIGFVGAQTANNNVDGAKDFMQRFGKDIVTKAGLQAEIQLIGTFLSVIREPQKQKEMEKWVAEEYPEAFAELKNIGFKRTMIGAKVWRIDRRLSP